MGYWSAGDKCTSCTKTTYGTTGQCTECRTVACVDCAKVFILKKIKVEGSRHRCGRCIKEKRARDHRDGVGD